MLKLRTILSENIFAIQNCSNEIEDKAKHLINIIFCTRKLNWRIPIICKKINFNGLLQFPWDEIEEYVQCMEKMPPAFQCGIIENLSQYINRNLGMANGAVIVF